MLQIDKELKVPYYVQVYTYYRREIEERRMPAGMRLASVRELAKSINVSKMTIEKAYFQLASEGYIIRRNKARYEVASLGRSEDTQAEVVARRDYTTQRLTFRYDFASGDMDMERFPIDIWRKYMNRVLLEPEYLQSCQDEQGVPDLRDALSSYVYETRGVHAEADNIIIGAGTAALLSILTNILRPLYHRIGVENPGFRLGREIFRSTGYGIVPLSINQGVLDMETLIASGVRLVYISPSHQFPTGTVMPAGMRHRLLQWAEERDGLIIEDDYDSELRYYGRPVPALQGLDKTGQVIYMGALSKVLPSFVRLSYMVLPPRLMELYNRERSLFRQGASVPEQCVLASYIRSGELSRQIRRLRKEYQEKGQLMQRFLSDAFGNDITMSRIVSGVYCHIQLKSPYTERELRHRAEQHGCRVLSMESFYETKEWGNEKEFLLSFSKIPSRELKQAVEVLYTAWTEKEGT